MPPENDFLELIDRAAAGDEMAVQTLYETYLPQVRRYVRHHLTDRSMRRMMDSVDVCQSIFGDLFVRMALGLIHVRSPEQMHGLLATMARNRLINHNEKQRASRRDVRRLHPEPVDDLPVRGRDQTASEIVAARELLDQVQQRLTPEERRICEQRVEGASWDQIGEKAGCSGDAARKKYSRTLERLIGELSPQ
jgi:RNA polymerase sigma-70 factor (ECF subfamily)